MAANRLTVAQLRACLEGMDPNTVVVVEGLYVGPAEPIPAAAAQMADQLRTAQAVIDLGNRLQRFSDQLGAKVRRDRRGV